jgi:hypothetical protein
VDAEEAEYRDAHSRIAQICEQDALLGYLWLFTDTAVFTRPRPGLKGLLFRTKDQREGTIFWWKIRWLAKPTDHPLEENYADDEDQDVIQAFREGILPWDHPHRLVWLHGAERAEVFRGVFHSGEYL